MAKGRVVVGGGVRQNEISGATAAAAVIIDDSATCRSARAKFSPDDKTLLRSFAARKFSSRSRREIPLVYCCLLGSAAAAAAEACID